MFRRVLLMTAFGLMLSLGGASTASAQPPRSPRFNYPIDYNCPMERFVEGMYRSVMGRDAYPHEIDYWMQRAETTRSRARLADEFIDAWKAHQAEYDDPQALGRNPRYPEEQPDYR